MAEPLTWLAVEALKAMVASITIDAGYHTDLGLAPVYLDRSQNAEAAGAFTVIIANEISPIEEKSGNKTLTSTMDITAEYCLPVETITNPELLAHRGRADLVRVFLTDLRGQQPGLTKLQITGTRITSAVEPGSALVIAQVSARATLSESKTPAT
jgi:hypothetical protein